MTFYIKGKSVKIILLFAVLTLNTAVADQLASNKAVSNSSPVNVIINGTTLNYWVATNGNDSATGDYNHPFLTIQQAQNVVRNNPLRGKETIIVNIRDGLYRLSHKLTFNQSDSGSSSGSVIYRAAPNETPIISGGQRITGWTLHDPTLNIWQAQTTVNTFTMPRQLYVNGVRATRARTPLYPNDYTPTSTGYSYRYTGGNNPKYPPTWVEPTDVEFVTTSQWKMMRCVVARVNNNTDVIMQTPCWTNANTYPSPWNFHLLSWLENAYEFLNTPGYWYMGKTKNPTTKMIYYIPRAGEDLTTADVELPLLQTLIEGTGTQTTPISYLSFEGLHFQYATWLDMDSTTNSSPSSSNGYVCDQSGFHLLGTNHSATLNIIGHDQNVTRTPGNVSFIYAQHITLTNNTFQHLGAVGLDFGTGSEFNQIVNNIFDDISGAGIQIGGVSQRHHPVASQLTTDNLISNNLVQNIGQEFYDAPGIYVGVTTRTTVTHNDIQNVPWAGIAIGWGWGLLDPDGFPGLPLATQYMWGIYSKPSAALGNQILHNKIQNFLEQLWDGGAIYSTGYQGTSLANGQVIAYNVALNKRIAAGGNTYYTDGGSRFITLHDNVSLNNPSGFFDYGPCGLPDSFPAVPPNPTPCTLNNIHYGTDMGGCIPYGDLNLTNNYFGDILIFFIPCIIYNPDYPVRVTLANNIQVSNSNQVPASILNSAGRQ